MRWGLLWFFLLPALASAEDAAPGPEAKTVEEWARHLLDLREQQELWSQRYGLLVSTGAEDDKEDDKEIEVAQCLVYRDGVRRYLEISLADRPLVQAAVDETAIVVRQGAGRRVSSGPRVAEGTRENALRAFQGLVDATRLEEALPPTRLYQSFRARTWPPAERGFTVGYEIAFGPPDVEMLGVPHPGDVTTRLSEDVVAFVWSRDAIAFELRFDRASGFPVGLDRRDGDKTFRYRLTKLDPLSDDDVRARMTSLLSLDAEEYWDAVRIASETMGSALLLRAVREEPRFRDADPTYLQQIGRALGRGLIGRNPRQGLIEVAWRGSTEELRKLRDGWTRGVITERERKRTAHKLLWESWAVASRAAARVGYFFDDLGSQVRQDLDPKLHDPLELVLAVAEQEVRRKIVDQAAKPYR